MSMLRSKNLVLGRHFTVTVDALVDRVMVNEELRPPGFQSPQKEVAEGGEGLRLIVYMWRDQRRVSPTSKPRIQTRTIRSLGSEDSGFFSFL